MTRDSNRSVSRRKFITTSGAVGSAAVLAGCGGGDSSGNGNGNGGNGNGGNGNGGNGNGGNGNGGNGGNGNGGNGNGGNGNGGNGNGSGDTSDTSPLTGGGSSTVFPVSNDGSAFWNADVR